MPRYYVNKNAQSNGDHEVHELGCKRLPSEENILKVIGIILILSIVSCATTSQVAEFEKTKVYSASFDDTWNAVMYAVNSEGLPINIIEKESGIIQTDDISVSASQLEDISNYKFNLIITPVSSSYNLKFFVYDEGKGNTSVQITSYIEAVEEGSLTGDVSRRTFQSSGLLENLYFSKISERLN